MRNFHSLSAVETKIVAWLTYDNVKIISNDEFAKYIPQSYKYKNKLISNLIRKNVLNPIKRGIYNFVPIESMGTGSSISSYLVPNLFLPKRNYYIGYINMFNWYGFTEQIPQTTIVINTSRSMDKIVNGRQFKFIKVQDKYMYGTMEKEISGGTIMISDKERTLVDLIYQPDYIGGIKRATEVLTEQIQENKIDLEKFIEYASRFPNITTRKNIGVILENIKITDTALQPLIDSIQNTTLSSFSKSMKGTINKKWKVVINNAT